MGIWARSLPGNLTIWREILTFEIKKYIRNSGKSDYLAGKNTFFQAVLTGLQNEVGWVRQIWYVAWFQLKLYGIVKREFCFGSSTVLWITERECIVWVITKFHIKNRGWDFQTGQAATLWNVTSQLFLKKQKTNKQTKNNLEVEKLTYQNPNPKQNKKNFPISSPTLYRA